MKWLIISESKRRIKGTRRLTSIHVIHDVSLLSIRVINCWHCTVAIIRRLFRRLDPILQPYDQCVKKLHAMVEGTP